MIIQPTTDSDVIKNIITSPEIWDRFCEHGDPCLFEPSKSTYWLVCGDKEIDGITCLDSENSTTVKMHPYLYKSKRHKCRDMILSVFKWIIDNSAKTFNKVIVSIPFLYKKVRNLAIKTGFIDEGVNRESYTKNGVVYDTWNMGITKSEITEVLNG